MTRHLMMDDFDRLATEPELAAQRDWWARLTVAGGVAAGRVLVWVKPWTNNGERDLTVDDPYGWTWGHAPSTHAPGVSDQMVGAPIEWFPPELAAAWRRCLLAHEAADEPIADEPMPPPGELQFSADNQWTWPPPDAEWAWPPPETPRLFVDPTPSPDGPDEGEHRLFYVDDAGLLVHCGHVWPGAVPEVNARLRRE